MSRLDSMVVRPGDVTRAVGSLTRSSSDHVLSARGEGRYLDLSRGLGGETISVHDLDEPPLREVVSVRGVWTGSAIVDATVSDGRVGVAPPPSLDPDAFTDVAGLADRTDVLRADVLGVCDELRGRSLVSFVAIPGPRGWFGLAAAVDTADVLDRLGTPLGPHLLVTASEWTLEQVDRAEQLISEDENVRDVGTFWDADGRYRAHGCLHHLTPALARSLDSLPPGIAHVETWLTPSA